MCPTKLIDVHILNQTLLRFINEITCLMSLASSYAEHHQIFCKDQIMNLPEIFTSFERCMVRFKSDPQIFICYSPTQLLVKVSQKCTKVKLTLSKVDFHSH